MVNGITTFKDYSVQFEKDLFVERCYVLFWESNQLKKVCVGSEPIDQPVPDAELVPLSRVIHVLESKHLPLIVRGASPSLLSVMGSNRSDGRRFVVYHEFNEETFIQFLRQAHQDIFGMVDIITIVEYLIQRLRNAVYEEWTEDKVVLCRCLRRGSVEFYEYRELLTDLISLWPSFVRTSVVLSIPRHGANQLLLVFLLGACRLHLVLFVAIVGLIVFLFFFRCWGQTGI